MTDREANPQRDDAVEAADARLVELVSYLDGELPDVESDRLERKLSEDAPLRGYVESLDRTWRLLDSLDEATASGQFTQKTLASIETVSSESPTERLPLAQRVRRAIRSAVWVPIVGWMLAGFIGTSAGLLVARNDRPSRAELEESQLLNDMSFLKGYREYLNVPSLDFLQQAMGVEANEPVKKEVQP